MTFSIADITLPNDARLWDSIVDACPDAWFRHTSEHFMEHRTRLAEAKVAHTDRSFLILQDGNIVGLAPLLISSVAIGESVYKEASIMGAPLPWPCFKLAGKILMDADIFAFGEIEQRARQEEAGRISSVFSPPSVNDDDYNRVANIVFGLRYADIGYQSHFMTLDAGSLDRVRERYRRDVRKYLAHYELSVLSGADITDDIVIAYSKLHEKDAGHYVRSLPTYQQQAAMARANKGFWVVAKPVGTHQLAGVLQIIKHKTTAYDASVAVDPDYQRDHVSHLLKWRTIETLLVQGISGYELGETAVLPSIRGQPSKKNYGISFFKDGWSRGETRTVHAVDKYLKAKHLDAVIARDVAALKAYFNL